ncbi:hypothetical protein [Paenibacillus sp. NEAU-GSW1]|nr:hypothetical protein [Paenibacillus sp. NEAU-GSW1]
MSFINEVKVRIVHFSTIPIRYSILRGQGLLYNEGMQKRRGEYRHE